MKISIITVCYNSEKTIEKTIQSVLDQEYECLEYIIVDGQSTDGTCSIISNYKSKITKFISEPDLGIYDAINKGIRLASGDIVGILNSDDSFQDNHVIGRIAKAYEEAGTEIIYANVNFISSREPRKVLRRYSSKFFKPWMFKFGFQPAHPTFYTRKLNFEKYGYYRSELAIAGDFELLLRFMTINNLSYKYINDTWVNMYTGGASTSGIQSVIKLNKEILFACKINAIYTNWFLIYVKYFIKWWGFIFK